MIIMTFKKYSERFKQKVLSELESGELSSYAEAQRKYNINGKMTLKRWIVSSKKFHLLHKIELIDLEGK